MTAVNVWWVYLAPQHSPSAIVLTLGSKVVLCCKHTKLLFCSFQHHGGRVVVVVADGAGSGGRGADHGGCALYQVVAVDTTATTPTTSSSWVFLERPTSTGCGGTCIRCVLEAGMGRGWMGGVGWHGGWSDMLDRKRKENACLFCITRKLHWVYYREYTPPPPPRPFTIPTHPQIP